MKRPTWIWVAAAIGVGGARLAFTPRNRLPAAAVPTRPVVFINPRSGDGRAARAGLAGAAARRGLETSILEPGEDLEQLVRSAVGQGADGLAMAGGDGSQALAAAIAAEHGAYAEAVSHSSYRESKLGTLLDSVADNLGPGGHPTQFRRRDAGGVEQVRTALMLVTNNPYRLGPVLGAGTRPRLDSGQLGVVDFLSPDHTMRAPGPPWRRASLGEVEIDADGPLPLGVDGEALTLEPPLRFRSRPAALRVLIAPHHPGASPAASIPSGLLSGLRALGSLAIHG